ncbi:cysteine desulfurase family protein [Leptospira interrogans]
MSVQRTYLDHNATAPLRPEARAAVIAALDEVGNPSSVHSEGRRARAIVEEAREKVAALVGARPAQVVFTSGATEANVWVMRAGWDLVMTPMTEHDSVLAPARAAATRVINLRVAETGEVLRGGLIETLEREAGKDGRRLLSIQLANSETGVIQPVADVTAIARSHGTAVHCDAVQAVGRVLVDFAALDVDCLSLSAHKIGGPKGVGALVVKDGFEPAALISGGGQERRRRSGTENVAGIAGFGAAAEAARRDLADAARITRLRDRLEQGARDAVPTTVAIAKDAHRLGNTASLAMPGHTSETLVIKLDLAGIAVSAGAACSSGKVGTSPVLAAMGLLPEVANSAVRVSLGWNSTDSDVDRFVEAWAAIANAKGRQRAAA